MPPPADTAALLTPPGPAGLALLRLRGPRVPEALARFTPAALRQPLRAGVARRAALLDHDGAVLDDILVSVLAEAPDWDAILHLHGSPGVAGRCLEMLGELGFGRAPDPGAGFFVAQDLIEAEAVSVLPRILTEAGVRWLLTSTRRLRDELRRIAALRRDDEVRTALALMPNDQAARLHCYCTPLRIALLGPPNAGKSTLVNALTDRPVSIVSPQPGTTRDWVEAAGELDGYPAIWIDTAGVRGTDHPLEAAGVARSLQIANTADVTLAVLDGSAEGAPARREFLARMADTPPMLIALNKSDTSGFDLDAFLHELPAGWYIPVVPTSALARKNLDSLAMLILRVSGWLPKFDEPGPITSIMVLYFTSLVDAGDDEVSGADLRAALRSLLGPRPD